MHIAVVIATTGRPAIVETALDRLARQTRAPDRVLVVGASEADCPARRDWAGVTFTLSAKGSSKQRNRALDLLGASVDLVVFLDDDFLAASDFLEGAERLMRDHPEVVAASGHLLADGFRSAGIAVAEADALIDAYEREPSSAPRDLVDQPGAYGCNMVVRLAALPGARFDENLPLYGWLEDLDYSARFAAVGRVVRCGLCVGVHLGVKSGRVPGARFGYSQIANPLYLVAKGTMARRAALTMAAKNIIANTIRSLAPEPYIDRRGRLKGNLLALRDIAMGRGHPTRVLDLRIEPAAPGVRRTT
jgi:GT2 family glycosyltransferase